MKITTINSTVIQVIPGRSYTVFAAGSFAGGALRFLLADQEINGSVSICDPEEVTAPTAFVFTATAPLMAIAFDGPTNPNLVVDCVLRPT